MVGTLKGYDQLMNLVLDDAQELLRGLSFLHPTTDFEPILVTDDEGNESSRSLGLMVARGTLLVLVSPVDGSEQIPNPFNVGEDEG